jgi:Domain of unknown function (DUF4349)
MPRTRNAITASIVLLLVLGALVGFLGAGTDDASDVAQTADAPTTTMVEQNFSGDTALSAAPQSGSAGGTVAADAAPSPVPAPSSVPAPTQKIVKNAVVRLEIAKDGFRKAFDSASRVAGAHGGFVVSSEASTESDADSHGVLVLRVPAASFDAVRADLNGLGTVKDEHLTGQDVGGQIVDAEARIRSLQAQEEALRTLMSKARTIGETVEVQGHLTQVRQQIEQLSGEKARLEDAAALATIRVELFEPGAAVVKEEPNGEPSPLRKAVTTAVTGAETVAAGTIIVLGWAIPLAALAAVLWLAARPFRRRPEALLAQDPS